MAETGKQKSKSRSKTSSSAAVLEPTAKLPPHNLEMERAVLCSALIDPRAIARVVQFIEAGSFYDRRHQLIFEAMIRLFSASKAIDVLTVSEELRKTKEL